MLRHLLSFFKELDTGKELCSDQHCFFFNEVATRSKLSSGLLVSFFNELDTRQGTVLKTPCFIF